MVIGIGVDVVHIDRMKRWEAIPGLFERFFHPGELEAALRKGRAAVYSLAARFAAKEAFGKALGTGLGGIRLRDIRVINDHNGKPDMLLYETALKVFEQAGGERIHLSLTHEHDNAIAMVVIEGKV